jgi:hypothetical protein
LRYKKLIEISAQLMENSTIDQVMVESTKCLQDMMNSEKAVIYLISDDQKSLMKYKKDSETPEYFPVKTGIVGHCFARGKNIKIDNHSQNEFLNTLVDIDTLLPSYNIIIRNTKTKKPIGIFQVAGSLQLSKKSTKVEIFQFEILQFFSDLVGSCVFRVKQINSMVKDTFKNILTTPNLIKRGS